MYQRILLAYDGSREGLVALREGALMARRYGAKVYLLSIVPASTGMRVAEGVHAEVVGPEIESYKALLERGVAVARQLGLDPVAKLKVGEPAPIIGAFAREIDADLLILGHRRTTLLERWWSGASGAYVTDYVNCSVLIGRTSISDEAFDAELRRFEAAAPAPADSA
jgi:nucleotide-binding universal stress UspA family protein